MVWPVGLVIPLTRSPIKTPGSEPSSVPAVCGRAKDWTSVASKRKKILRGVEKYIIMVDNI